MPEEIHILRYTSRETGDDRIYAYTSDLDTIEKCEKVLQHSAFATNIRRQTYELTAVTHVQSLVD